jgi:hypothetical protein
MSFDVSENVSKRAAKVLKELGDSCTSEGSGVADILNSIASNGGELATNKHLICCAEQIMEAAERFIHALGGSTKYDRLLDAVRTAIANWASGDLAGAVTRMSKEIENIEKGRLKD